MRKPVSFASSITLGALLLLASNAGVSLSAEVASSVKTQETPCPTDSEPQFKCVDPTACCEESKKVIGLLGKLVSAYANGDISTYERYLDDKCTLFEENTNKMTVGKVAVLEHLRGSFAEHAPGGPKPLVSLTIDQPYAKVHGDLCVVTFVATLKTGGAHPMTEQAHVTDVFVKRNGEWKKHYWRGKWEPIAEDKKS